MSKRTMPKLATSRSSTSQPAPVITEQGSPNRRRSEWFYFKKNSELLLLLLPGALLIFIFAYIPMFGVVLAFKDFRYDQGIFGSAWVGFKNFEFLFVSENAWRITRNTVLYESAYLITTTLVALVLAILMNEMKNKWLRIHQTALFIPYCLSWVVVSYLTGAFLDHSNGYLNHILESLHLATHTWYLEPEPWPYILIISNLWKGIGFATLVYFAGIIGINQDYYEAAKIEGATRWQLATKVTLPLISNLVTVLIILAIGNIFRGDFGLHYFIPNNSGLTFPTTDIIDTYVYRALSVSGEIGNTAAIGLYQSFVGLVLVLVANWIVRKINDENSLF